MGRQYTKEAEAQELQMEALSHFFKAFKLISEANSVLSGINGGGAVDEHLAELGFANDRP